MGLLRDLLATPEPAASSLLFCLAAGFVQGALFGLTYRQEKERERGENTLITIIRFERYSVQIPYVASVNKIVLRSNQVSYVVCCLPLCVSVVRRYVVRSDRDASNAAGGDTATTTTTLTDPPVLQMDGFTVGHLGDGCVAAFALTSALAQSEVPLTLAAGEFVGVLERGGGMVEAFAAVLLPAAPFLPRAAGDLFLYSATRAAIDRALDQGLIKPFP